MSQVHKVNPKVLKEWLEKDEAILIDVREPGEHRGTNITKALNIPLSTVNVDNVSIAEHENKKLVFHCQAGKRSDMACKKIIKENPDFDIWDLEGGIDAWGDSDFSINKGSRMMPLNRQVKSFTALFILLGYFLLDVSFPIGDILILSAGIGLAIAGLFDNCLMIPVLAKMPWNQVKKSETES